MIVSSVIVFLPLKHTGPWPKTPFAIVVVLIAQPLQSTFTVAVLAAFVIVQPKGIISVTTLVQAVGAVVLDCARTIEPSRPRMMVGKYILMVDVGFDKVKLMLLCWM